MLRYAYSVTLSVQTACPLPRNVLFLGLGIYLTPWLYADGHTEWHNERSRDMSSVRLVWLQHCRTSSWTVETRQGQGRCKEWGGPHARQRAVFHPHQYHHAHRHSTSRLSSAYVLSPALWWTICHLERSRHALTGRRYARQGQTPCSIYSWTPALTYAPHVGHALQDDSLWSPVNHAQLTRRHSGHRHYVTDSLSAAVHYHPVPNMAYNLFGGTLSLNQSINQALSPLLQVVYTLITQGNVYIDNMPLKCVWLI